MITCSIRCSSASERGSWPECGITACSAAIVSSSASISASIARRRRSCQRAARTRPRVAAERGDLLDQQLRVLELGAREVPQLAADRLVLEPEHAARADRELQQRALLQPSASLSASSTLSTSIGSGFLSPIRAAYPGGDADITSTRWPDGSLTTSAARPSARARLGAVAGGAQRGEGGVVVVDHDGRVARRRDHRVVGQQQVHLGPGALHPDAPLAQRAAAPRPARSRAAPRRRAPPRPPRDASRARRAGHGRRIGSTG